MNEILMYLSLKYCGEWLAIYDSLKRKEKITHENLLEVRKEVKCNYTSLLDDFYPTGLKDVYKPPFGIFSYGNYSLINNKNNVTVFGQLNEQNKPYLDAIRDINGNILWVNLTNRELSNVITNYKTNNIFWMDEIKNKDNRLFNNLINDEQLMNNNLFFSELWEKNSTVDYSNQLNERLYLGVTHKVLILDKLDSKRSYELSEYGCTENILFIFKNDKFDEKTRKLFSKCKVALITKPDEISQYL